MMVRVRGGGMHYSYGRVSVSVITIEIPTCMSI